MRSCALHCWPGNAPVTSVIRSVPDSVMEFNEGRTQVCAPNVAKAYEGKSMYLLRWTTYRCPSCNAYIRSRVVTAPRVGLEYKKCRSCGFVYRTPDTEWQHMTNGQRVGYFLNEWALAVI